MSAGPDGAPRRYRDMPMPHLLLRARESRSSAVSRRGNGNLGATDDGVVGMGVEQSDTTGHIVRRHDTARIDAADHISVGGGDTDIEIGRGVAAGVVEQRDVANPPEARRRAASVIVASVDPPSTMITSIRS